MDQHKLGILMYPKAQLAAVYGLLDLFFTANRIVLERNQDDTPPFDVNQWQFCEKTACVKQQELIASQAGTDYIQLTAVIIPPNLYFQGTDRLDPVSIQWLQTQHQGGAVLCSICTAAFFLAQSGLLDGRPATTHWRLKDELVAQFPEVLVQTDPMIIDDGDIMTAGGVTAWIDLGLRLIHRYLGASIMLEVAQFFLVDPQGREQRHYSQFSPKLHHRDAVVRQVQHWLQMHYGEPILTRDMAAIAQLGNRTFLRRFKDATGMRPIEYLQALRISKAREMLEFSQMSLQEIAWNVGYQDPAAFRKVFIRITGLRPQDYRRRFAMKLQEKPLMKDDRR